MHHGDYSLSNEKAHHLTPWRHGVYHSNTIFFIRVRSFPVLERPRWGFR